MISETGWQRGVNVFLIAKNHYNWLYGPKIVLSYLPFIMLGHFGIFDNFRDESVAFNKAGIEKHFLYSKSANK